MPLDPASPSDFRVKLASDEIDIPDGWMTQTGGNRTAGMRRFHDGNGQERVIGGRGTRDDMTVAREWIHDRDLAIARWADRRAGKAKLTVNKQPLDSDGNAFGDPIVFTARLISCAWPDTNTDAAEENASISLVLAPHGEVA